MQKATSLLFSDYYAVQIHAHRGRVLSTPGIRPGLLTDPANNLLFDFHQYFDGLGGAYGVCEPWSGYYQAFQQVTNRLRSAGAQGIVTEFGGGPCRQCEETLGHVLAFLEANGDVWRGWTAWGSFNTESPLYLSLDRNSTFYRMTAVLKQVAPGNELTRDFSL